MAAPVFDANALSAFTSKIQKDIQSGADPRRAAKQKGGDRKPSKDARGTSDRKAVGSPQGKKRTRDGKEKVNGHSRNERPTKANSKPFPARSHKTQTQPVIRPSANATQIEKKSKSAKTTSSPSLDLRQIVTELGGDDDDLQMIEDAASDSELEGQPGDLDADVKKDLQRMVKDLGFASAAYPDAETSEEEEDPKHLESGTEEAAILDIDEGEDLSEEVDEQGEDDEDDEESSGLIAKAKQALETIPTSMLKPNANGLVFEPQSEWHTIQLPGITAAGPNASNITSEACTKLHEYAKQLLEEENDKFSKTNSSSNPANKFYTTIMSSGTLSDKISALTLSVQESPLHNVHTLENLVGLARKRNRGQAVETLGALKDLLGPGGLLPSERRLRNFAAQPALKFVNGKPLESSHPSRYLPKPLTKAHLIHWAYEDWLKSTYFEILKILEVWCNDEIPYTRLKAVGYIFDLLRDKPEQEANLLRLLVNKLGDTDKKIASKASFYILQIENSHPAMKPLIISAINNDLLFKPHQTNHAKYYGIITLNQTVLSSKEDDVARQLLNIYFALFIVLLKKPTEEPTKPVKQAVKLNKNGEVQGGGSAGGKKAQKKAAAEARSSAAEEELREKMLSGVLTGVNRSMPFVDKDSDFFEKHLDTLFRVTHSANFNTSVQALMLIQQLCGSHQAALDRFYRTLYESLLDPRVLTSSKQALYLNLLYRALRADLNLKRIKAFVKRMLQTTMMHQPSFACAVMFLVRELEALFPGLAAFIDQPEADDSEDEGEGAFQPNGGDQRKSHRYDGRKRDPEYAAAESSCMWELSPLQEHFHPSVSLFATSLLKHESMPSKPDLSTNTLIHFLDRFVYRNPKKTAGGLKGQSLMQPMAAGDASGLIVSARSKGAASLAPVNTEGFRSKASGNVAPDEVFFHKYFNAIGKKGDKTKKRRSAKDEDDDEEAADEDEDEIWNALVESRPEIEGDDDEEDDLDLDLAEFDDAMDGVEDEDEDEDEGSALADGDEGVFAEEGEDGEGSDEPFDFDEEDALLDSDDELPDGIGDLIAPPVVDPNESQASRNKKTNKRRKMLRSLPMFASVDDYAKMLEGEEE